VQLEVLDEDEQDNQQGWQVIGSAGQVALVPAPGWTPRTPLPGRLAPGSLHCSLPRWVLHSGGSWRETN